VRRLLGAGVLLVALLAFASPASAAVRCTGDSSQVQRLDMTVAGENAWGLYALPASKPKGLVVFFHGYTHTAQSWAEHIRRTATQEGVIAVAMDYRGQIDGPPYPGTSLPRSRGWQVSEGAADSIAAAQLFDRTCKPPAIVAYGVSMGGNASGLALAARAKRASGAPLFDQWFDVEGAVNVIEIYLAARQLAATGNVLAGQATEDIEREMGGPIEQRPEAYSERTVVRRADDVAASGVRGVTLVHGADDGLVPYAQSREIQSRLRALNIPADMITVGTRGEASEPGTTLTGSLGAPGYTSPFAGHADEASTTHIVGNTGFDRLSAYLRSGETPHCRDFVVDGTTRTMTQVPGTGGC
jgi:acetyl esterase/lipase